MDGHSTSGRGRHPDLRLFRNNNHHIAKPQILVLFATRIFGFVGESHSAVEQAVVKSKIFRMDIAE